MAVNLNKDEKPKKEPRDFYFDAGAIGGILFLLCIIFFLFTGVTYTKAKWREYKEEQSNKEYQLEDDIKTDIDEAELRVYEYDLDSRKDEALGRVYITIYNEYDSICNAIVYLYEDGTAGLVVKELNNCHIPIGVYKVKVDFMNDSEFLDIGVDEKFVDIGISSTDESEYNFEIINQKALYRSKGCYPSIIY